MLPDSGPARPAETHVVRAGRTLPDEVDVAVIGAGMAGLAVAAEIGRRGRRSVAVFEAGPDRGFEHVRAMHDGAGATELCLRPESDGYFHRPYRTDGEQRSGEPYLGLAGLRRLVGGRSLYWGGVLLPIEDWALRSGWPAELVSDLTTGWDGGPGLYRRVAEDVRAWGADPADGSELRIGASGFVRAPLAVRDEGGGRWSAFSPLSWWHPITGDPRVAAVPIHPDQPVQSVRVTNGRASGLRLGGASAGREITAGKVVLAGGTVQNTRLAAAALAAAAPGSDLPPLTGLVDKLAQGFTYTWPSADRLPAPVVAAARTAHAYYRPAATETQSNHFVRFSAHHDGSVTLDTWLMGEQERGPWGTVLPADGPSGLPTVRSGPSPSDERVLQLQQRELREFWAQLPVAAGSTGQPLVFGPGPGSPDLAERLTTRRAEPVTYCFPLGSELHEGGTLAFGELLRDDHQFHRVPGLFAAGPSAFPRTGAANPTMTTLALGRRLGAVLSR